MSKFSMWSKIDREKVNNRLISITKAILQTQQKQVIIGKIYQELNETWITKDKCEVSRQFQNVKIFYLKLILSAVAQGIKQQFNTNRNRQNQLKLTEISQRSRKPVERVSRDIKRQIDISQNQENQLKRTEISQNWPTPIETSAKHDSSWAHLDIRFTLN